MKKLAVLLFLVATSQTWGADCRPFVARLKHLDGSYEDYNKVNQAINHASSGDKVIVGRDTDEELMINNASDLKLVGDCNNKIKLIKIQKSTNVTIKDLTISPGKANKVCVQIISQNVNHFNEDIKLENLQIKNCLNHGVEIDANNKRIKLVGNRIENNAGYGILKNAEPNGPKPARVDLIDNIIINNHGTVVAGQSSKDLGNFLQILDETDSGNQTSGNNEGPGIGAPISLDLVAKTGLDQTLSTQEVAKLDGTASYTLANKVLTYSWAFVSRPAGSQAVLANASTPQPQFTVDLEGDYVVELSVNDGQKTVKDQVRISTSNSRPVAVFSPHNKITIGEDVEVDGSDSFDPDETSVSYQWILVKKPTTSQAILNSATSAQAHFVADVAGEYTLELQTSDGVLTSKKVRRTLSTGNNNPIADAGEGIKSYRNISINLDGHSSVDPDMQALTYQWTLLYSPVGAVVNLADATQNVAHFSANKNGLYVFNLLVSDGTLKDAKTVTVELENRAPIVSIVSPPGRVEKGATVSLNSAASDPDGDNITYQWSFLARPSGSSAQIQNAQTANATFIADVGGQYKVRVQVTDIFGEVSSAETTIKASTRPVARLSYSSSTAYLGDDISFNASQSSDADGDALSYSWSLTNSPEGSASGIVQNNTLPHLANVNLTKIGSYTATLIVSDGMFDSLPVSVNFSGIEKVNHLPVFGNISNQSVEVAQSIKINLSATDGDSDKLTYLMSPNTPLLPNMTFNGIIGEFTFKPGPDQVGVHNITFIVSDGKSNVEKSVTITVTGLEAGSPTSYRGKVYDANSTSLGHDIPIVGAHVSMIGSSVESITDANGEFVLENIPLKAVVFKIDCTNATNAADGKKYANFIELMHLTVGARNVESRPFYLPRVDPASTVTVDPTKETVVTNQELGIQVVVPKNGVENPDGTPYTGTLSISLVPRELAPVTLPEPFNPGMLITVQPSGVKFTEPVPISYPNIDNLPAGTETNIYQIDDSTGMFGVFAKGRVTADGKRIETISGGLVNGSWGFAPPPPPIAQQPTFVPPACTSPKQCVGSGVDLQTGALFDDVAITSYKSGGIERGFNFIYSSNTAKPGIVFNPITTFPNADSIPDYVSIQLFVDGAKVNDESFMDTREVPNIAGEKIQHKLVFDASHLTTGLYKHDLLSSAHFPSTSLRFRASENPNFGGEFGIINNQNSPYGAGWSIDVLKSLHVHENGNVLMAFNGGSIKIFKLKQDGSYEIPVGVYLKLEKIPNIGYRITSKEKTVYNFNNNGLLISEVDRNSNETTYYYYAGTKRLQHIEDPTGKRFSFYYDNQEKLERVVDPANRTTWVSHDDKGNLVKITKPDSTFREMNYDESHLLLAKSDYFSSKLKSKPRAEVLKAQTGYQYVSVCNRTSILRKVTKSDLSIKSMKTESSLNLPECKTYSKEHPLPLIKPAKDAIELSNKNGNISKFDIDESGQIIRRLDPLNRLTRTVRDSRGNVVFEEDGALRTKQTLYDLKNNPTQITVGAGSELVRVKMSYDENYSQPLSFEQVGAGSTLFKLDAKGNVISTKDSQGGRSYYSYNSRGQVITSTDPGKNQTQLRYYSDGNLKEVEDTEGNISRFYYDLAGNIVKIVDAKTQETLFEYSVMNRLIKATNAKGEITQFEYDFKGNLITVIDSRSQRTEFVYDVENNLIERIDPKRLSELFEYDFEGNLLSHTNRKGQKISYEYNTANELVKKILPDSSETVMTYDLSGYLKTVEDNFSKLAFTYDGLSRVKTVSTNGAPYQPNVTLVNSYTKSNRTKVSTSFGDVQWAYNLNNSVKSVITFSGNLINLNYDSSGRRTNVVYPNGIITKLAYDESSRLAEIAHQKNNLDMVSYTYSHDSNGNRSQMNVTSPIVQALSQVNYTYDQVNQLTGATRNVSTNADEVFTYDNLGNRLKKNNQATSNIFDNSNRIIEDDKYIYAHDDNGNMTKRINKQSGYTYKYLWNVENKLQFVTEHLTESSATLKTHTYIYDAIGRRIMKDSNGVIRKYIYDNEDILLEFNNNDNLQAKYTHGPGIDEPLEMVRGAQKYFYHTDGLGSIIAMTDPSGNIVQSYSYSSFGEAKVFNVSGIEINPSSMIQSPYGYTGREWDTETGLLYYRSRYFDPRIGRFISEDQIGFDGGDTNLYRYTENNPVVRADPSGQWWHVAIGALVGGISGAITAPPGHRLQGAAIGAATGAMTATGVGGVAVGAVLAGASDIAFQLLRGTKISEINRTSVSYAFLGGVVGGVIGNSIAKFIQIPFAPLGNLSNITQLGTISNKSISAFFGGLIGGLFSYVPEGQSAYMNQTEGQSAYWNQTEGLSCH